MPKKTSVRKNLRRVILNLHQYTAGKSIEEIAYKYNLDPKKVIKLGSNENVLGPSPIAIKSAKKEIDNVNIYPQVTSDTLVKKIKNIYKLKSTEVFIGNGMDHVFEMLARLFLDKGDETIICPPTFSCYELATLWAGGNPRFIPLKKPDYSLDIPKILKAINKKTKMIFLCSPNNPTGNSLQLNEIKKIIESTDKIVFLDEAYTEFGHRSLVRWIEKYPNLIIGRTFSKIYGLAGLRIGYVFIHKTLAEYYRNSITPFVASRVGQAAALAALDDKKFLNKTRKMITNGKKQYFKELSKRGIKLLPSNANFITIDTSPKKSKDIALKLMEKGIIVRDCASFGFGGDKLLRITIGTKDQNKRVIKELVNVMTA